MPLKIFVPLVFLLVVCSCKIQEKESLSILLSPFPAPGHYLNFMILGDALKEQGHNVTFLMPHFPDYNKPKELCEEHGFHYIPAPVNMSYYGFKSGFKNEANEDLNAVQLASHLLNMFLTVLSSIDSFVSNELDTSQLDVAVVEEYLMGTLVCPKNEHLPIVYFSPGIPNDPSLLPSWPFPHIAFPSITHDTSITDRLIITAANALLFSPLQQVIIWYLSSNNPECWERKYNYYSPPGHGVPFILATVMGFEYPKTNLPLVDYVGPFIPNTLDPLPSDIDLWLSSKKENSVVYISMGSIFAGSQELAEALYNGIPTNYSVLWSATSETIRKVVENKPSSDRYLVKSWIPQISALNHSSISLAILHGGAGGVHQALYFGIPMVVVPLGGDQLGNAVRVQYWKLGVQLKQDELTANNLKERILKIESGPYRSNAKKMSIIMKNAGGVKRAVELIEFYAAVGYDHLVPAYVKYHWSWIQYHNVDVQALLLAIGALMLYLCFKLIKCMCQCCCCRNAKEKKE